MGAKVIQEGEQASAAEREVIERSGRSVFRPALDDLQDRIIAAIGIEPDPTDLDPAWSEARAAARPPPQIVAAQAEGIAYASAPERHGATLSRRHFHCDHPRLVWTTERYANIQKARE